MKRSLFAARQAAGSVDWDPSDGYPCRPSRLIVCHAGIFGGGTRVTCAICLDDYEPGQAKALRPTATSLVCHAARDIFPCLLYSEFHVLAEAPGFALCPPLSRGLH